MTLAPGKPETAPTNNGYSLCATNQTITVHLWLEEIVIFDITGPYMATL